MKTKRLSGGGTAFRVTGIEKKAPAGKAGCGIQYSRIQGLRKLYIQTD
ncbi:MAG: hypothetical protein LBH85_08550 [Treponema sp.]|nr:hypothetical protein [Treponema sp.]